MGITVTVKKITKLGVSQEDCTEPRYPDDMKVTIRKGPVTVSEVVEQEFTLKDAHGNDMVDLANDTSFLF